MKRIIFVLLVSLPILMFGQEQSARFKQGATEKIVAVEIGTATTSNGSFQVNFEAEISEDYAVSLTCYSAGTTLYISEKTKTGFVIKCSDGTDVTFDYVVFVRKIRPDKPQNP